MGQSDILEFLEAHPNTRFCSDQIRRQMGTSKGATIKALKALRRAEMICYAEEWGATGYKYVYWVMEK